MKPQTDVPLVDAPALSPERQLLWDAANYMEKYGHCAGIGDDGSGCAIHAIVMANYDVPADGAIDFLQAYIDRHIDNRLSVPMWSDSSDQATVVATLRAAALEGQ